MGLGLDILINTILTGTDEEVLAFELREEDKISTEDMIKGCRVLARIGISVEEFHKRLTEGIR